MSEGLDNSQSSANGTRQDQPTQPAVFRSLSNRMPIQLNNPSQVSSNIARMVQNMIPQIEQQIAAQMNEPELAEMTMPVQHAGVAPPLPPNPYLTAQGRHHGGHSHSHSPHAHSHSGGHTHAPHSHNAPGGTPTSGPAQQQQFPHAHMPFHPANSHVINEAAHPAATNMDASSEQNTNPLNQGGGNGNFVVDFGRESHGIQAGVSDATPPPPTQDSNNNGGRSTNSNNPLSNVRTIWKATQGIPFVVLMLAKILYDHRLGILCLIGLFGTYYHANSSLKRQISQRDTHGILDAFGNLCWIIVFLAANIIFIYYVFDDEKLYRSLYLQVPEFARIDIWTLFWIVGVSDFVIKYATIMVKAAIAIMPKQLLPVKKKGKHYMLVEVISQFHRSLIPITPWLLYLYDTEHGGQIFAYILCTLYVLFKAHHVWGKSKELRKAFASFRLDVSYGTVPRREDLQKVDNVCPICQDKLSDPVKLSCSHIFCEDCVSMWFDREKTCPMCRAQIVDNPMWRDGTTSATLDMF